MTSTFIFVVLASAGMTILLVEKHKELPLSLIFNKSPEIVKKMLDCYICCAWWASLIVVLLVHLGLGLFLIPFITVFVVYVMIEVLNAIG